MNPFFDPYNIIKWVNIDGRKFCYRFYSENNANLDNLDHGFDLGFIELLVIRVINDCLLIPVLY